MFVPKSLFYYRPPLTRWPAGRAACASVYLRRRGQLARSLHLGVVEDVAHVQRGDGASWTPGPQQHQQRMAGTEVAQSSGVPHHPQHVPVPHYNRVSFWTLNPSSVLLAACGVLCAAALIVAVAGLDVGAVASQSSEAGAPLRAAAAAFVEELPRQVALAWSHITVTLASHPRVAALATLLPPWLCAVVAGAPWRLLSAAAAGATLAAVAASRHSESLRARIRCDGG
jgi:hypothetical protein